MVPRVEQVCGTALGDLASEKTRCTSAAHACHVLPVVFQKCSFAMFFAGRAGSHNFVIGGRGQLCGGPVQVTQVRFHVLSRYAHAIGCIFVT